MFCLGFFGGVLGPFGLFYSYIKFTGVTLVLRAGFVLCFVFALSEIKTYHFSRKTGKSGFFSLKCPGW